MLADLVRAFCKEKTYEVYENYSKTETTPIGEETYTTIGIVLKQDDSGVEVLDQLLRYITAKGLFEQAFDEFDGAIEAAVDPDRVIVCFPRIRDYHPMQA